MDENVELNYELLYERVLRMRVDELMQEPYEPDEELED
jgi:hypothetical protein